MLTWQLATGMCCGLLLLYIVFFFVGVEKLGLAVEIKNKFRIYPTPLNSFVMIWRSCLLNAMVQSMYELQNLPRHFQRAFRVLATRKISFI